MQNRKRRLPDSHAMFRRLPVVGVALCVALGACSGGGDKQLETTSRRTTTTAETDRAPNPTVAGATTSVVGSSPTTRKGTTATTRKGSGPAATTQASSAGPNAAPGPARTGTYDYAQSGTTSQPGEDANKPVPPEGTLSVSGGQSQVFRRTFDPDGDPPPSDIYYSFTDGGPFITKVVARYSFFEIVCTFGSPVPAPPWPADSGRTFSGHATCTNGFAADFSGSVTGRVNDSVGGASVEAVVIKSTLHVYDDNVDLKINDTQHWAPSLRVPTYSNEIINGTAFGAQVSGNITSKLKSVTPR